MARLEGKVALITGAGAGIGLAAAELFAREGAKVMLAGRTEQSLRAAVERIGPETADAVAVDVAQFEANERMVEATVKRFGGLDIFLANAGVEGATATIEDYPVDAFDQVIAINVRGVFLGLKVTLPVLRRRGGGSIIVTSSIGGIKGRGQGNSAYIASKHAEIGLMRTAALEGAAHGIRVNCVSSRPDRDPDDAQHRGEPLAGLARESARRAARRRADPALRDSKRDRESHAFPRVRRREPVHRGRLFGGWRTVRDVGRLASRHIALYSLPVPIPKEEQPPWTRPPPPPARKPIRRAHSPGARATTSRRTALPLTFPPVPARKFLRERDAAFAAQTPTGAIALDTSDVLATKYPATTPTILCRYLKLRAGESLHTNFVASGEIFYVMTGRGESRNAKDDIAWVAGDVFCFPGGTETVHRAGDQDSLLFCVTNEPLLAFERLRAPAPGDAFVETTHWPAAEIDRHFEAVWKRPLTPDTTGYSVQFTSLALAPSINTIPSINCSINTLAAGRISVRIATMGPPSRWRSRVKGSIP